MTLILPRSRQSSNDLSNAENSVIDLIMAGYDNKEIADKLCIGIKTVKFHLGNIYKKLDIKNRNQLFLKIQEMRVDDRKKSNASAMLDFKKALPELIDRAQRIEEKLDKLLKGK